MRENVWQRLLLVVVSVMLMSGGGLADDVYGLEFANQGHNSVHRLFFVANGFQYTGAETLEAKEKAQAVALRYGLSQCHEYLKARGLTPADYRFKSLGDDGGEVHLLSSEPIDAAFQGDNLVGVRVVGEVEFEIAGGLTDSFTSILSVNVASDKKQYSAGDNLVFMLHGNMSFHGSLLDLNPAGELIQLLPNGTRKQTYFEGNMRYIFPDKQNGDDFDLAVGAPFGREQIRVIASDLSLSPVLDDATYGSGFGVVERDFAWVEKQLRGQIISHLKQSAPQQSFRCLQVYENNVDLATSGSHFGYEQ